MTGAIDCRLLTTGRSGDLGGAVDEVVGTAVIP